MRSPWIFLNYNGILYSTRRWVMKISVQGESLIYTHIPRKNFARPRFRSKKIFQIFILLPWAPWVWKCFLNKAIICIRKSDYSASLPFFSILPTPMCHGDIQNWARKDPFVFNPEYLEKWSHGKSKDSLESAKDLLKILYRRPWTEFIIPQYFPEQCWKN